MFSAVKCLYSFSKGQAMTAEPYLMSDWQFDPIILFKESLIYYLPVNRGICKVPVCYLCCMTPDLHQHPVWYDELLGQPNFLFLALIVCYWPSTIHLLSQVLVPVMICPPHLLIPRHKHLSKQCPQKKNHKEIMGDGFCPGFWLPGHISPPFPPSLNC